MKITNVTVRNVEKENSRVKGIATIIIDDCFAIHDVRVIEGKQRMFISMPSRKNLAGVYRDIAHPINQETRVLIEQEVLKAFAETIE